MSKLTPRRPADVAAVIQFLRFKCDSLDTDDLKWLSGASQSAAQWASDLSDSIAGIGHLIANDGCIEDAAQSGNFQGADDVPGLLFVISRQVAAISELAQIGFDASSHLRAKKVPND